MSTTPPPIGQPWPAQGGIYLGQCRGAPGQPPQHLIALTDPAANFMAAWGEYGQDVPSATSRFDGKANTIAMAAAGSQAAQRVLALQVNGVADCFIPSQAQLQLACAIAPEVFDKGYHWSSTQPSRYIAFVQDFADGSSSWDTKEGQRRVRAFRGFQL